MVRLSAGLLLFLFFSPFYIAYSHGIDLGTRSVNGLFNCMFEIAPGQRVFHGPAELRAEDFDIHFEVFTSWIGKAAKVMENDHVPYLTMFVEIRDQDNNVAFAHLTPHINLPDGLHYAANINLENFSEEKEYDIKFIISGHWPVALHDDWENIYKNGLPFNEKEFYFKKVLLKDLDDHHHE